MIAGASEPAGQPRSQVQLGDGHTLNWSLLDDLTESILRRVMRVACGVGSLVLLYNFVDPLPSDPIGMSIGTAATLIIFALTYLPIHVRWLSFAYPWTLVLVGASLTSLTGPDPNAMLLIAGGLFFGSLVLKTRRLVVLVGATIGLLGVLALGESGPQGPEAVKVWTGIAGSLASVIAPAAVAGRMLLSALISALQQRQGLVEELSHEQEALKDTVATLESTRQQLTHAQKLELVSQMAGGIAHDMNNALTAVIGEASLLDDSVREERDRIIEAGEHAAKLTHQLMVFGRRDTAQPRPLDLGATVLGLLQAIRRILPSDIVVSTAIPERRVVVVADRTHLLQILLNLAGNARDAMDRGGTLTLALEVDDARDQALLRISDTGCGISSETLPLIFDPFFTTKPAGKGTGLGLANVRQLIEGMGGSVEVESQENLGTTFCLHLPLSDAAVPAPARQTKTPSRRTGTVLVVDDDVRVRAVAYTSLERVGHRVLEAPNLGVALQVARTERGAIDLLLTDVVMAGGGGADVIREMRKVVPRVRVLVMSGYTNDEALRRGVAEGEFPFIAKPFTSDQLTDAVDSALAD